MALPADFFTCPPLSEDEVEAYTRLAERTARELVQYGNVERGPIKWKSHTTEPNLLVYEGFDTRGPSNERVWCAISEIQASIEEVQMMTYAETSADYKLFTQKFFGDILDAARLYNIVEPTAERPLHFVGINWVLQKSPGRGLIRNRDYVFVEGHFETEIDGRRAWIRAQKSINIACCPDLQADCGYVRATHTRSGYIYIETDRPGYLTVTQYNQGYVKGEVKGKMADWFYASSIVGRYRKIAEVETVIRKYRLSKATFLPKNKLLPPGSRNQCTVCDKPFSKSKKLNCRKCGQVVCRHCSKIYELKVNNHWGELRVCEPCVFGKVSETRGSLATIQRRMSSNVSKQSPEDWVAQLQRSAEELSRAEEENNAIGSRDSLLPDNIAIHSQFKPSYKPAMAEKFHVDGFFTPRQESKSESTATEASTGPDRIYLLDETDPLYNDLYHHSPPGCYSADEMRSTGCSSLEDESAFFVLNRDSELFQDDEYLKKYLYVSKVTSM
ncbi:unnamed protein product [Aphanomyces euteiches]|nr:hypothetical protein AeRB84_012367 [Aphanomyces euteiches]